MVDLAKDPTRDVADEFCRQMHKSDQDFTKHPTINPEF